LVLLWVAANVFLPVAVLMTPSAVSFSPGRVAMKLTGWKVLPCEVIKGSEVGYAEINGIWHEEGFHFETDPVPGSSRPLGKHYFGIWVWDIIETGAKPNEVLLTIKHLCGGQVRTSTMGPFDVN
jgi:hypothetical protein